MGAGVQGDGHAGGGALVQGAVGQGAQKQPGQLPDVGHALDEFFGSEEKEERDVRIHFTHVTFQSSGLFCGSGINRFVFSYGGNCGLSSSDIVMCNL